MCDGELIVNVKFNGGSLTVRNLKSSHTVLDLKNELYKLTRVQPINQKLLGLRAENNVPITDALNLSYLILKPNVKIMLLGSTEEAIMEVNKSTTYTNDVVDDFDYREEDVEISSLPENLEKVKRRSKAYKPRKLSEFRSDKRLLVLDIDYTIFDHLTPAESALQLARPYLLEFLKRAYVNYDIAIWSATSMTWILAKLGQLGIIPAHLARSFQHRLDNTGNSSETNFLDGSLIRPNSESDELPFRICLLLDSSDMISVNFSEHGVKDVKPLAVIWDNHSQWGPHNTIMLDDVRRNFIMNPQSGLRVRSYRDAHINYKHDRELLQLAIYLELIAMREPDFRNLNHHHWDRYVSRYRHLLKRPKHHHRHHHRSDRVHSAQTNLTDITVDHNDIASSALISASDIQTDSSSMVLTENNQICSNEVEPIILETNLPNSSSPGAFQKSNTTDDHTTK